MIERIRELDSDQVNRLKQLGHDTLAAISPPIASMVYSQNPDQLQALQQLGPDALGAMSPQLADMLYGPDTTNTGQGVGQALDPDSAEKRLGRYPDQPPIIVPPFPQPPDQEPPDDGGDEYKPDPGEYVSWNVDPGLNNCQTCLDNADDDPRPYGTEFSSGDTEPPAHAHCGCFLTSSLRGSCPIHGYSRSDNRIFELSSRY